MSATARVYSTSPACGIVTRYGGSSRIPSAPLAFALAANSLACCTEPPAPRRTRGRVRRRPRWLGDDLAELLQPEGVEFAGAAGDEDTSGARVDTLGDVLGEPVVVDVAGCGERGGDGEEQDAVEHGELLHEGKIRLG